MSDVILEQDKNLLRLAERGCIVALVENQQTGEEHCVEMYQDQNGYWRSKIQTFNLEKQTVAAHPFPKFTNFSKIGRDVPGRWLGRFKLMSGEQVRNWVQQKQAERKNLRNIVEGPLKRSVLRLNEAIRVTIQECNLPVPVWRGHLDDLRVEVDGYDTLELMASAQCRSLQTWADFSDVVRFAYCSCFVGMKDVEKVAFFFSVVWREEKRVWIFPFTQNGTRYFALLGNVRQENERHVYPFLCKDGFYRERHSFFERNVNPNDHETDLYGDHPSAHHCHERREERSTAETPTVSRSGSLGSGRSDRSAVNQDISKDFLDNITVAVDLTDEDRNPLEAAADADTRMNMDIEEHNSVVDLKTWLAS